MAEVIATTDDPVLRPELQDEHNTWLRSEYLLGQSVKDLTKAVKELR